VKIRVEAKDHQIVSLELSGEWRTEPVDLHCLVGPTVSHFFTQDGFYDHAEPRPEARRPEDSVPAGGPPAAGLDVGPTDGTSCVPGA
jgi:hypothetical protein